MLQFVQSVVHNALNKADSVSIDNRGERIGLKKQACELGVWVRVDCPRARVQGHVLLRGSEKDLLVLRFGYLNHEICPEGTGAPEFDRPVCVEHHLEMVNAGVRLELVCGL